MSVRSAVGVFCVSTLVAGGFAPATAAQSRHHHDSSDLQVTVCKRVKDRDDRHSQSAGRQRHRDQDFWFFAKTDQDEDSFSLQAGECTDVTLGYDDNTFFLKEKNPTGYRVSFRVWGDDEDSWSQGGRLWVKFDDRVDDPSLNVTVVNTKVHHHHHRGQ